MRGRWGGAIAWALLIEALVLWPSPPTIRSPFLSLGLDKIVHAALFGVLAALLARALGGAAARPWWPAFAGSVAYGALTELQQSFIPSRSMELGDILADSVGAALGLGLFAAWALRRREPHR